MSFSAISRLLGVSDCGGAEVGARRSCVIQRVARTWRAGAGGLKALSLMGDCSVGLRGQPEDELEGPQHFLALPAAVVANANAILRDYALLTPALDVAGRHAFTHTAIMALLNEARLQSGVLVPGQFAWLKLVDRSL